MSKIPYLIFGALLLFFSGCMQTKTLLSEPDIQLSNMSPPLYCGSFASYVQYDLNNQFIYNDSVSSLCSMLCNKAVKSGIRKLPQLNKAFVNDSNDAKLVAKDILEILNLAIQKESIKKFRAGEVFAKLCADLPYDNFLFLIPTGYTRTTKQTKSASMSNKPENVIARFLAQNKPENTNNANFIYFPGGQNIHPQGSNIYVLIYRKSEGKFIFYRQQFYLNEKIHTMQIKYIKKQLEYLLKEYL